MESKKIFGKLNIVEQCRSYQLSLWQCPHFVFLTMGLIIIVSTIFAYFIGTKFLADPLIVSFITILLTAVLFILDYIITKSFERLAMVAKMRADFISIISHQLRSPISNLRWAIEAFFSKDSAKLTKNQLEYLEIIKENSKRMGDLVSNLLTLTKIEENRLPQKKVAFSLGDLVKEVIKEFSNFAQAKKIPIEFQLKELPLVLADPLQIKRVLEDLLDNALRYTPNARPEQKNKIEISLFQKDQKVICQIKDNGIGIPREEQKYVFKKFFRAENAKRLESYGSGLGLFIAKSIIESSGGKIHFQSEENKGSNFYFSLPIAYEKNPIH